MLYKMAGMRNGRNSRILMGCYILNPWSITIGERSYINERCVIDGCGGVLIGDDVSISIDTKILSATHNAVSSYFEYEERKVIINNHA